jgi:hypothetical protein
MFNFPTSEGSHIPSSALELRLKMTTMAKSNAKLFFIRKFVFFITTLTFPVAKFAIAINRLSPQN